jgi:pre-rRNA-processing protein IPI3
MCLAASRDGSFLFGGGKSGKIYVWALGSGVLLNVFDGHFREVACLAVTTDGACLVSGGDDGVVHAWMVSALVDSSANSKPVALHSWTGHGLKISCLFCAVGPLGETVVLSASLDCTVKMWRMGDGALVSDVAFPGAVTSLAMDAFEELRKQKLPKQRP